MPTNINEEHLYWLAFNAVQGIGPKRFALLTNYFGSAKNAWLAPENKLQQIGLQEKLIGKLINFRKNFDPHSYNLRLANYNIKPIFIDDKNYPKNLKNIDDAPFVIYVKGELKSEDQKAIGVVGSRKMTGYGYQVTQDLVKKLANSGLTIISGLARGIDSAAHKATLEVSGRTIAVLGCGLDLIYPPENLGLAKQISDGHGALISEYPLGAPAIPFNFPARNRIISGLSLGVLVVEGAADSGSMITATDAVNQGREVFAVPGPITSPTSAGPANLIKMGAKLVWDVDDILNEFKIDSVNNCTKVYTAESKEEEIILSLLEKEPLQMDEIIRQTGMDSGTISSSVSILELKGVVKNYDGKYILI